MKEALCHLACNYNFLAPFPHGPLKSAQTGTRLELETPPPEDVRGDQTCEFTADSLNWSLQSKKFSETYLTVSKIGQERLFKGRIFHLKIMQFYQKFAN